jgi:hypothetical protein
MIDVTEKDMGNDTKQVDEEKVQQVLRYIGGERKEKIQQELVELEKKRVHLQSRLNSWKRKIMFYGVGLSIILVIISLIVGFVIGDFVWLTYPIVKIFITGVIGGSIILILYSYYLYWSRKIDVDERSEILERTTKAVFQFRTGLAGLQMAPKLGMYSESTDQIGEGKQKELIPKQPQLSYFDNLVEINVSNLAEYYGLVKSHTSNSFQAALGTGLVGFGLIVVGLIFSFFNTPTAERFALISTASGIITEFIAAIFFYLYNRTVRQLKDYHDSLLSVQNILLAFKIVEDTKDEAYKAQMMQEMISYLVGSKLAGQTVHTPKKNKT